MAKTMVLPAPPLQVVPAPLAANHGTTGLMIEEVRGVGGGGSLGWAAAAVHKPSYRATFSPSCTQTD
jgi:hypothetical protein